MDIKTYISFDTLVKIAEEEGCEVILKTTCALVRKGKVNNRLYIARTKDVRRININGFHIPDPTIARTPRGGPVGTFVQEFNFSLPEPQVLANWRKVCRELDQFTPDPKKERQRPANFRRKKDEVVPGPSVEVKAEESVAEHAERLIAEFKKKRDLSAKMGFPLSPKTVSEFQAKVAGLGFKLEA